MGRDIIFFYFSFFYTDNRLSHLAEESYWNAHHRNNTSKFDWLLSPKELDEHIHHFFPQHSFTFMDLGCGTSECPLYLIRRWSPIMNLILVDFSAHALHNINGMFKDEIDKDLLPKSALANVSLVQCSGQKQPFKSNSIEIIFEKGTTDSILKAKDGEQKAIKMVQESYRVLKPDGYYLQVTDEDPELRLSFLQEALGKSSSRLSFKMLSSGAYEYYLYSVLKL